MMLRKTDFRKFSKEGGKDFYPIYAQKSFTHVHKDSIVYSMREVEGFCSCNRLNSSLFARLQGGYYILEEGRWRFVANTIKDLSFKQLKELLTTANQQNIIKSMTAFYTVTKLLQMVGEVEETTGWKNIVVYDIDTQSMDLVEIANFIIKNEEETLEVLKEVFSKQGQYTNFKLL